jgi:hypothetical protein
MRFRICAFIKVSFCKYTYTEVVAYALLYMHIYGIWVLYMHAFLYAHIWKATTFLYVYLRKVTFVNAHIYNFFHICAYTEANFGICVLPYMRIYESQLPYYMNASIYVRLQNLTSINAHIWKHSQMEADFHICALPSMSIYGSDHLL